MVVRLYTVIVHCVCSSSTVQPKDYMVNKSLACYQTQQDTALLNTSAIMAACATCERALTLPPTIHYLLLTYPFTAPLYNINRQIPRCKHCDEISTYRAAINAQLPPPRYRNLVQEIEERIMAASERLADGIQVDRWQGEVHSLRRQLVATIMERDEKIRRACEWFWGIWGKAGLELLLP